MVGQPEECFVWGAPVCEWLELSLRRVPTPPRPSRRKCQWRQRHRDAGIEPEARHNCRSSGISGVAFRGTPRDDSLGARWYMEERGKSMEIPIG